MCRYLCQRAPYPQCRMAPGMCLPWLTLLCPMCHILYPPAHPYPCPPTRRPCPHLPSPAPRPCHTCPLPDPSRYTALCPRRPSLPESCLYPCRSYHREGAPCRQGDHPSPRMARRCLRGAGPPLTRRNRPYLLRTPPFPPGPSRYPRSPPTRSPFPGGWPPSRGGPSPWDLALCLRPWHPCRGCLQPPLPSLPCPGLSRRPNPIQVRTLFRILCRGPCLDQASLGGPFPAGTRSPLPSPSRPASGGRPRRNGRPGGGGEGGESEAWGPWVVCTTICWKRSMPVTSARRGPETHERRGPFTDPTGGRPRHPRS